MECDIVEPSEGLIKEDVRYLKEWMSKQPHLPMIDDDEWLTTFLYQNKLSLEKTKCKLEGYYSLRSKYPDLLKNRDPLAPELLITKKAVIYTVSNCLTKDGCRLVQAQLGPDPSILNIFNHAKRLFMILDMLYLERDRGISYVLIVDVRHYRYQHFLKILMGLKVTSEILNDAYTERATAIHYINAPHYMDKVINTILQYFPKKYADRVFIHSASKSKLLDMVDTDVLCSDFGGNGPSLAEYDEYTHQKLLQYRRWFKAQDSICSNEALRCKDERQLEDMRGSFRKLDID